MGRNFEFYSPYIPAPKIHIDKNVTPRNEFNIRYYPRNSTIQSLITEFEEMHRNNITHFANMPANLNHIMQFCKHYGIVCLDRRMGKYVADKCSLSIENED